MASEVVARSISPRGEVVLRRRGEDTPGAYPALELRVNGVFVMDTVHTQTERRLAKEALAACRCPRRVLVGGLGLGFTLSALLDDVRVRSVVVAEVEPAVVGWVGVGLVPHNSAVLVDPRVDMRVADVRDVLATARPGSFDAVVLDVDNGPDHLVHPENAGLYGENALAQSLAACTADGALLVWSADHSPSLLERLSRVGGTARHLPVPVTLQGRATSYHLYVAQPRRG